MGRRMTEILKTAPIQEACRASYDHVAEEYARRRSSELDHRPFDREILERFASRTKPQSAACDVGWCALSSLCRNPPPSDALDRFAATQSTANQWRDGNPSRRKCEGPQATYVRVRGSIRSGRTPDPNTNPTREKMVEAQMRLYQDHESEHLGDAGRDADRDRRSVREQRGQRGDDIRCETLTNRDRYACQPMAPTSDWRRPLSGTIGPPPTMKRLSVPTATGITPPNCHVLACGGKPVKTSLKMPTAPNLNHGFTT